jgi:hypothetical protein
MAPGSLASASCEYDFTVKPDSSSQAKGRGGSSDDIESTPETDKKQITQVQAKKAGTFDSVPIRVGAINFIAKHS